MLARTIAGQTLSLVGELDIYAVKSLYDEVRGALESGVVRRIDLQGVTAVDGAGLQLLMWLVGDAKRRGQPLAVEGAGGAVHETFSFFNWRAA